MPSIFEDKEAIAELKRHIGEGCHFAGHLLVNKVAGYAGPSQSPPCSHVGTVATALTIAISLPSPSPPFPLPPRRYRDHDGERLPTRREATAYACAHHADRRPVARTETSTSRCKSRTTTR